MLIIAWCNTVYAQGLKDFLDKGDKYFAKKDYENALKSYLEALKADAEDANTNFRVGVSYLHSETKGRAARYLEKAYRLKQGVDADIDSHLGITYRNDHEYRKAIDQCTAFRLKNKKLTDIAEHKIAECEVGDSLSRHPAYVTITNLGNMVNSNFHEYSPLVTADGNTLIFTTNRTTDAYKIKSSTNYEDIYISHKQGSEWSFPQKISPNINIKYNDAAASLSAVGKTLFLYYEDGSGDIYTYSLDDAGQWT
jgi:tetratricopeptide (TPR) repeat protein